jgi:hypothetical protein
MIDVRDWIEEWLRYLIPHSSLPCSSLGDKPSFTFLYIFQQKKPFEFQNSWTVLNPSLFKRLRLI